MDELSDSKKPARWRKCVPAVILLIAVLGVSGCQTLTFYGQALKGQYQLLAHRQPLEKLVSDPETPARLKTQLELVQKLRAFAEQELKLPVDGHYAKYVDVHRSFVVWNVEAAREFSLEPKAWWYPLVGSLEYRGYFSERRATNYGAALQHKGYDVFVGGVEAYSTLGWFKDPILNTFIYNREPDLAETISTNSAINRFLRAATRISTRHLPPRSGKKEREDGCAREGTKNHSSGILVSFAEPGSLFISL